MVTGEGHAPLGEVLHRRLAESVLKGSREGRSRKAAEGGELGHRPPVGRVGVHGAKGHAKARVGSRSIPAWRSGALAKRRADGVDQDDIEQPVQHCLLPWLRGRQFAREQPDDVVERVMLHPREMQHRRERLDQAAADIAGEPIRAAQEHRRVLVV